MTKRDFDVVQQKNKNFNILKSRIADIKMLTTVVDNLEMLMLTKFQLLYNDV